MGESGFCSRGRDGILLSESSSGSLGENEGPGDEEREQAVWAELWPLRVEAGGKLCSSHLFSA